MPRRSNSEVGHSRTVAAFAELISRSNGCGPAFNPSRPELQIDYLQQLYQQALMALRNLAEREVLNQQATNERKATFAKLRPLTTRIISTMVAYGVSEKSVEDARVIKRRIDGVRLTKKNKEETAPATPESPETDAATTAGAEAAVAPRTYSTSRQSYDLLVEHFSKLVLLLQREANYQPNEPELSLPGLQAYEQDLRYRQEMVIATETELENARILRTQLLYDGTDNIVDRAIQVKNYIKAVFGTTSPQYRQVAKLRFIKVK